MNYDLNALEKITNFTPRQRDELLVYYEEAPEKIKRHIHKRHPIELKHLKGFDPDHKAEFYYAGFLSAIFSTRRLETSPSRKARLSKREMVLIDDFKIERASKKSRRETTNKKKAKLLDAIHQGLVLNLRQKGLSWAKISVYLEMYYQLKISPTYLRTVFKKQDGMNP
jgi:hypothetical protein